MLLRPGEDRNMASEKRFKCIYFEANSVNTFFL